MKEEFEKIAGYEVTNEDYYRVIEPMYMATDLSKADFINCLDRKRFEIKRETETALINRIKSVANKAYEKCGHVENFEEKQMIDEIIRKLNNMPNNKNYYAEIGYEYEEIKRGCTFYKSLVIENIITGKNRKIKLV